VDYPECDGRDVAWVVLRFGCKVPILRLWRQQRREILGTSLGGRGSIIELNVNDFHIVQSRTEEKREDTRSAGGKVGGPARAAK
jgi:hypothetical protein